MHLSPNVHETMVICSLRFDGYRWLEERGGETQGGFSRYVDPVVQTLRLYAEEEANFAVCFALQRHLCKWGGETLPPEHREHAAWRYLFLHLYRQPVPACYRLDEYVNRWERERVHVAEEHAAQVRAALLVNALDQDRPPIPVHDAAPSLGADGVEAASWVLASELVRRAPRRLRVIQTHPGGGAYDCLSVLDGGRHVSDLNRQGSLHVLERLDGQSAGAVTLDVWPRMAAGENPRVILDEWCRHLGLAVPATLPAGTPASLTYRVIAACCKQTTFDVSTWHWVNGFLDTSGGSCEARDELFARFPDAGARLRHPAPDDVLRQPACCFWFLTCDGEPKVCLETNGTAWLADGRSLSLVAEYRRHRDVATIAALLVAKSHGKS